MLVMLVLPLALQLLLLLLLVLLDARANTLRAAAPLPAQPRDAQMKTRYGCCCEWEQATVEHVVVRLKLLSVVSGV